VSAAVHAQNDGYDVHAPRDFAIDVSVRCTVCNDVTAQAHSYELPTTYVVVRAYKNA
jgi:hypothetical protein